MKLGQQLAGGGKPAAPQGKVAVHASPGDLVVPTQVIQAAPPALQQAVLQAFKAVGLNPVHYLVPQKGSKQAPQQQPAQQPPQQPPQGEPQE